MTEARVDVESGPVVGRLLRKLARIRMCEWRSWVNRAERGHLSVHIMPLTAALTPDIECPMCFVVAGSLKVCVLRVDIRLW